MCAAVKRAIERDRKPSSPAGRTRRRGARDLDARVPLQDVEDDRDDLLHEKHLMVAIRERLVLESKSKESCPGVGCQRDSEPTSGVGKLGVDSTTPGATFYYSLFALVLVVGGDRVGNGLGGAGAARKGHDDDRVEVGDVGFGL